VDRARRRETSLREALHVYRFTAHDRELLATLSRPRGDWPGTFIELETLTDPARGQCVSLVRDVRQLASTGEFTTEQYTDAVGRPPGTLRDLIRPTVLSGHGHDPGSSGGERFPMGWFVDLYPGMGFGTAGCVLRCTRWAYPVIGQQPVASDRCSILFRGGSAR